MLRKFTVKGFKSLDDVDVEFGAFNVFIGANGSGKSNLLEAIGVLGAAAAGRVEPETLRYRGVRPGLPALYKSSFRGTRVPRFIVMNAESGTATYRLGLDNPIKSPEPRWGIHSEALYEGTAKILTRSPAGCRLHQADGTLVRLEPARQETAARAALLQRADVPAARELLDALDAYAIYSPSTSVLRGLAPDISRSPLGLSGSGLPEAVRSLLRPGEDAFGAFDLDDLWELIEWADDVAAVSAQQATLSPAVNAGTMVLRFRDRFMLETRNTLSGYDASEGALYVLFLLALASHSEVGPILAIDNFDQALHPRLACALTRLVATQVARAATRQFFVTTHNPLVLDGLDLANDAVRLFAVERADSGATRIRRIELTPELRARAGEGLSLSRLWTMGRLGGAPRNL